MAEKLRVEVGVTTKLIKSSGGVFEIKHNGRLIFSKKETGRFPDPEAIIEKIKNGT